MHLLLNVQQCMSYWVQKHLEILFPSAKDVILIAEQSTILFFNGSYNIGFGAMKTSDGFEK